MRCINYEKMEQRVIYLRGYYNGLSVAEPDEQFQKIYEKIFEQLMWAMGDQIDCAQDNNNKT